MPGDSPGGYSSVLHDHSLKAGAELKSNSKVERYVPDEGRVVLTDGTTYDADLVLVIDGTKSHARYFLKDNPADTLSNSIDKSG